MTIPPSLWIKRNHLVYLKIYVMGRLDKGTLYAIVMSTVKQIVYDNLIRHKPIIGFASYEAIPKA